jgi:hypothetical protein
MGTSGAFACSGVRTSSGWSAGMIPSLGLMDDAAKRLTGRCPHDPYGRLFCSGVRFDYGHARRVRLIMTVVESRSARWEMRCQR